MRCGCFFRKMKEKTLNNGGFFRIDMPATQWIEVSDDGQSAAGHWLTMSRQIDRSESGNQYRVRIGLVEVRECPVGEAAGLRTV